MVRECYVHGKLFECRSAPTTLYMTIHSITAVAVVVPHQRSEHGDDDDDDDDDVGPALAPLCEWNKARATT